VLASRYLILHHGPVLGRLTDIQGARHVKPNTLKTCKFHGKGRPILPAGLTDYDLVLTTYATLSAEYKSRGALHNIVWFRIVLDEGKTHI
jgi:SNF2 family DNA or RNA helicase